MKVTSRSRPDTLLSTISKYIELASDTINMVWLFSFDKDCVCAGIEFGNKLSGLINPTGGRGIIDVREPSNKITAINSGVNDVSQSWHILLNISDDQIPIVKGYDNIIRNAMPPDLDASLWFNDGWQPRINTQEIVGRTYYDRFGYIYNPAYKSFYCDNEATEVAASLGKQIISKQCIIKHFHPGWDARSHIKRDELYNTNDKYWKEDQETFNKRKSCNYPGPK